jgi:hypothetical protein
MIERRRTLLSEERVSWGLNVAVVFAIGLLYPWLIPPLIYGGVTKRWTWFQKWCKATNEVWGE